MKISATLAVVALAVVAMLAHGVADARVGGGRSMGAQRPSVTPRAQAPQAAAARRPPRLRALPRTLSCRRRRARRCRQGRYARRGRPAASGASRWLGPIAGIAAGLGIAALLSHFGLPEGLGTFLLIGLLAVGAVFLVRMLFARRAPREPLAYAGPPRAGATPTFDKSAIPEWGGGQRVEPKLGTGAVPSTSGKSFPPGFDAVAFARHAKEQFRELQAAHDAGDRAALRDVLTPEMYAELVRDLETGRRPPPRS
jgi:predicted lipid-binding transport protein (Tim44 family)